MEFTDLSQAAVAVLETADARAKAALGRRAAAAWRSGALPLAHSVSPPDRPGRPPEPPLLPPRRVKKRKITSETRGRIALLHALAHIELNAVDLAWDAVVRFPDAGFPRAYVDDWVRVGDEESKHFLLIADRLEELGSRYGALPAHDGLWQAAVETADDPLARQAVVPLVLEARGLDVTPPMIAKLREVGDDASADILQIIHDDEIGHVAVGKRWFDHLCDARGLEPVSTWQTIVRARFRGGVKPPFNIPSREAAGFDAAFYGPLGEEYLAGQRQGRNEAAE
ncbi:ferritin-like domain-containing protein [Thalassobaculum sp. OXR-137]|uniref:ferritin-like domain-containing protein n=1 Tax=Thalassobaculum sp. OXR-137 TaxID=3100173 RepID=UPI002AC9E16E|nr:ferritin-like domain-containing protein [Thalassobaculum sp. OXR-137]WPZ36762.1 ferritin-like domain-containing protein [Thalassobaculum sp. OXR-137]